MKTRRVSQAIAVLICAVALPAFGQSITLVTTFDYPDAVATVPFQINDKGDICGYFTDSSGTSSGFIRRQSGEFAPPLVDPHGTFTEAAAINDSGLVVGVSSTSDTVRGFFYSKGTFTTYYVPGSEETGIFGLNNAGDFVGWYVQGRTVHAFTSIGGTRTNIQIPGTRYVLPFQINASGAVAGSYRSGNTFHGFYLDAAGALHYPIDFPGGRSTDLGGINEENWMAGQYYDDAGVSHGLVYQPPATFVTFDYPGTTYTELDGINRYGDIVGIYMDRSGNDHGFIAKFTPDK